MGGGRKGLGGGGKVRAGRGTLLKKEKKRGRGEKGTVAEGFGIRKERSILPERGTRLPWSMASSIFCSTAWKSREKDSWDGVLNREAR